MGAQARVLRPMYGELVFFEHEFRNPTNADAVFEARGCSIRTPLEQRPLSLSEHLSSDRETYAES